MHGKPDKRSKPRRNQSAVTSGRRLFAEKADTQSPRGRRFVDLLHVLTQECGGQNRIDVATRNIIRRVAFLTCILEDQEQAYVRSGKTTIDERLEYQRISNTQARLMKKIGLLSAGGAKKGKPLGKPDDDDDDGLDPLSYAERGGTRSHRERLNGEDD